jgi:hypothetical protein
LIFRIYKIRRLGTETSSGWSAHLTKDLAKVAAFEELAERDALMVHWLKKIPMKEIDPTSFPNVIKKWVTQELVLHKELRYLRLLITTDGYCPTVTAIMQTVAGRSIVSHASASNLFAAYKKAMVEGCRLASNLEHAHFFDSSKSLALPESKVEITAGDHGMFYAFHQRLPPWFFGKKGSWSEAKAMWKQCITRNKDSRESFTFNEIVKTPVSVGYAESPLLQKLYFGTTKVACDTGRINFSRLNIGGGSEISNMMPHFIS